MTALALALAFILGAIAHKWATEWRIERLHRRARRGIGPLIDEWGRG